MNSVQGESYILFDTIASQIERKPCHLTVDEKCKARESIKYNTNPIPAHDFKRARHYYNNTYKCSSCFEYASAEMGKQFRCLPPISRMPTPWIEGGRYGRVHDQESSGGQVDDGLGLHDNRGDERTDRKAWFFVLVLREYERFEALSHIRCWSKKNKVRLFELSTEMIVVLQADVDKLWVDVLDAYHRHYHFEHEWQYVIVTLATFQAKIAKVLPVVFYVFFGGDKGTGKTNILDLMCELTKGKKFDNVSPPALARSLQECLPVFLDEIDNTRKKEDTDDSLIEAMLRQGYKSGAVYTRCDKTSMNPINFPIYGFKAFTYRKFGKVDDAFKDRGFNIGTVRFNGDKHESYGLVTINMFPEISDIPDRLQTWGEDTIKLHNSQAIQKMIRTDPNFEQEVIDTGKDMIGANRTTELMVMACAVARVIGISLKSELQTALAQRVAHEDIDSDELEEFVEAIREEAKVYQTTICAKAPVVRFKQSVIRHRLDDMRSKNGKRTISNEKFARFREAVGIEDTYVAQHGSCNYWNLPEPLLREIIQDEDTSVRLNACPPSPPSPPDEILAPESAQGDKGDKGGSNRGDKKQVRFGIDALYSAKDADKND